MEIFFSDGPMVRLHRECETPYRQVLERAQPKRASPLTTLEPRSAGCRATGKQLNTMKAFLINPLQTITNIDFSGDEAMMHALLGNHILEVVPQTFNGSLGEKNDALYVGDFRPRRQHRRAGAQVFARRLSGLGARAGSRYRRGRR